MMKRKRGRPIASRNMRVKAEFRTNPDVQMLARVFIAVAMSIARQKTNTQNSQTTFPDRKGDGMT